THPWTRGRRRPGARPVPCIPWRGHLDADVAESVLHRRACARLHFLEAAPARMKVTVGAVADLAAQELIQRHPRPLAPDVPDREVDAAHRVEQDGAVTPVGAHVAGLPDVFDLVHVAP